MKRYQFLINTLLTLTLLLATLGGIATAAPNAPAQTASIGDYVWEDLDQDGIYEGEPGVPGVTVNLYDGAGNPVASTTTDPTGIYSFLDLTPGDYYVEFVLPSGYVFSPQDQGADDTLDSDANPTTGQTIVTTLDPDENDLNWDAGMWQTGGITAHKFNDLNGNAVQDAGEPDLSGWTMTLLSSCIMGFPLASGTTDGNGNVTFGNLQPANYSVDETPQAGWTSITPTCVNVTLAAGGSETVTFGNQQLQSLDYGDAPASYGTLLVNDGARHATVPDVIFSLGPNLDLELDGQPSALADGDDLNPAGAPDDEDGVVLPATLIAGTAASVDVTLNSSQIPGMIDAWIDFDGNGVFDHPAEHLTGGTSASIPPNATIPINFTVPATAVPGPTYARFRLSTDGGLTPTGLAGDGEVEDYPATIQQLLDLGDYVWYDADQDGIQDAGEPGVQDIVVDLYQRVCTGQLIASTTTDANGNYLFQDLYPGIYCLQFSNIPAGWSISPQNQGADDTVDSDADPATAQITDINLQADDLDEDMGLYAEVSIGDWVWYDDNEDGIQDGTELGVPDVTVTLYHCDGDVQVGTTTTDANGLYRFNDVLSGRYYLAFVPPTGYEFTLQNQGSDAALDSDPDPATGETVCFSFDALQDDLTWDAGLYQPEPPPPPPPPPPPEEPPIVPEPSTLLLLGGAISGLAGYVGLQLRARRRR